MSIGIFDELCSAEIEDVGSVGEGGSLLKKSPHLLELFLSIEKMTESKRSESRHSSFLIEELLDTKHEM